MHTSNKDGISFGVLDLYNYRFEVEGIDPAPLFIFLKLRVRRLVSFKKNGGFMRSFFSVVSIFS